MKPDELVAENLGLRFSGLSEPDSPPDKRKKYDYSVETHLNGLDRQLQELLANIESGKANQEALTKFLQTLQQLRNWFEQLGEEYAQNFKSQKPQFSFEEEMLHDSDNAFKLGNRLRILWLQSERFEKTEILRQIQKEYGKLLSLHATLDRLEQQAKGEPSDKGEENETAPREAIAKEMAEIIAEIRGWPTLYLIQQG